MGRPTWVSASWTTGHASVDMHLDSPHAAASLVYSSVFEQNATVLGGN